MMAQQLKGIDWDDMIFAAAGFVTVIMMILMYSISNGIACGFIVYTIAMIQLVKLKKSPNCLGINDHLRIVLCYTLHYVKEKVGFPTFLILIIFFILIFKGILKCGDTFAS